MPVEVIGIDHIYLAVSDLEGSSAFYDPVMQLLGFRKSRSMLGGEPHVHYHNRHYGFTLRPAHRPDRRHDRFSPGLHHFCFRVEDNEAVDEACRGLRALGLETTDPRLYPEYAPDYYAIFFSDPDGMRLEITNYREERRRRHDHWGEGS